MRRGFLSFALLAITVTAHASDPRESPGRELPSPPAATAVLANNASPVPSDAAQLLLVRTAGWASVTGTLRRYARSADATWQPVGEPIAVNVGRNGMAWGRGLHAAQDDGPVKKEGDAKAPAGVFHIGPAFGADEDPPSGSRKFPYIRMRGRTCVEDPHSKYYNQVVATPGYERIVAIDPNKAPRPDPLFQWGIIVQHNFAEPERGAGSCIFLHIWRGLGSGTAGCTTMTSEQVEETIRWLDPASSPVLVQLPDAEYDRLRDAWALP